MNDPSAHLLAAIDARAARAEAAKAMHFSFTWPRLNGKATMQAFMNENSPEAVLRRCAADRKVVEAVQRRLTGHPGPCLNWVGQDPEDYTQFEPCALHVEWNKTTLDPLALDILAEAYGLEATE